MAEQIVEGMLEVTEGLVIPQLVAVEAAAIPAAQEFVELWEAVFNDTRTAKTKHMFTIVAKANHSLEPDTTLHMKQTFKRVIKDPASHNKKINFALDIRGMSVSDPDGEMEISLDLKEVPIPNLADDGFAELIMDYFRSHLAGLER